MICEGRGVQLGFTTDPDNAHAERTQTGRGFSSKPTSLFYDRFPISIKGILP